MFIKHFREVTYRVPDPLHPGHTAFDRRLDATGTHAIVHHGKQYSADVDGWIDAPDDVAKHFLGFPGWLSLEMVDEEVVAGRIRREASNGMLDKKSNPAESNSGGAGPKRRRAKTPAKVS